MSQPASQAAAFFKDVTRTGRVWTARDDGGYPAPMSSAGQRAQPFWSTEARVRRIIRTVEAYAGFEVEEIALSAWRERWLPNLRTNGFLLGINWSGPRAVGYDFPANEVLARLDAAAEAAPTNDES